MKYFIEDETETFYYYDLRERLKELKKENNPYLTSITFAEMESGMRVGKYGLDNLIVYGKFNVPTNSINILLVIPQSIKNNNNQTLTTSNIYDAIGSLLYLNQKHPIKSETKLFNIISQQSFCETILKYYDYYNIKFNKININIFSVVDELLKLIPEHTNGWDINFECNLYDPKIQSEQFKYFDDFDDPSSIAFNHSLNLSSTKSYEISLPTFKTRFKKFVDQLLTVYSYTPDELWTKCVDIQKLSDEPDLNGLSSSILYNGASESHKNIYHFNDEFDSRSKIKILNKFNKNNLNNIKIDIDECKKRFHFFQNNSSKIYNEYSTSINIGCGLKFNIQPYKSEPIKININPIRNNNIYIKDYRELLFIEKIICGLGIFDKYKQQIRELALTIL